MRQRKGRVPQTAGSMKTEDLASQLDTSNGTDLQYSEYDNILSEQADIFEEINEEEFYSVANVVKASNQEENISTDATDTRNDMIQYENPNIAYPIKRKSIYEGYNANESIESVPSDVEDSNAGEVDKDEEVLDVPEEILKSHESYIKSISRGKYIQMLRAYSQETATGKQIELPLCFDFHLEERHRLVGMEMQRHKLELLVKNSQMEKALFIARLRKKEKDLSDAQKMIHQLGGVDQFKSMKDEKEKLEAERAAHRRELQHRISSLETDLESQKSEYLNQINDYITRLDEYEQIKETLRTECQKYKEAYQDQADHVSSLEEEVAKLRAENALLKANQPQKVSIVSSKPASVTQEINLKRLTKPEVDPVDPIFVDLFAPLSNRKHQHDFKVFVNIDPQTSKCSLSFPSHSMNTTTKMVPSYDGISKKVAYVSTDAMEASKQYLLRHQANNRQRRVQSLSKRKKLRAKKLTRALK